MRRLNAEWWRHIFPKIYKSEFSNQNPVIYNGGYILLRYIQAKFASIIRYTDIPMEKLLGFNTGHTCLTDFFYIKISYLYHSQHLNTQIY